MAIVAEQLRRDRPGGIGTYARELARALATGSAAVELVASRSPLRPDPLAAIAPIQASHLPHEVTARLWSSELLRLDPGVSARADVMHATSFHFPSPRTGSVRPALSVFVHDLAWRSFPEHYSANGVRFHERALGRARHRAHHLLVPSTRTADALLADGVAARRIHVVHEGCDHLPAPSSAPDVVPAAPYLLTVSTIEPRKNLARLLAAYERAVAVIAPGERPDLVVVGAKGWDGRGSALPPQIPDGVRLAGHVDDADLAALFASALAFVYVPELEGFGLPPLEAMHAGLACLVSSAVPSVTETKDPASLALLTDPYDTEKIAGSLVELIRRDDLRADLSRSGREHAARCTWAASAAAHRSVWEG